MFPLLAERVITFLGRRYTFVAEGMLIWIVVLPLALWGLRGATPNQSEEHASADSRGAAGASAWPLSAIVRTSMFWAMAGAIACSGLVSTAVFFHQISVLGEQGLNPRSGRRQLPSPDGCRPGRGFVVRVGRRPYFPKVLMSAAMVVHALALGALPFVAPGWGALLYGAALGAAASGVRAVESAALPFYFGTASLGTVRGLTQSVAVASTAVGPILLSSAHGWSGSYRPGVMGLALLCVLVGGAVCFARKPRPVLAIPTSHVDSGDGGPAESSFGGRVRSS